MPKSNLKLLKELYDKDLGADAKGVSGLKHPGDRWRFLSLKITCLAVGAICETLKEGFGLVSNHIDDLVLRSSEVNNILVEIRMAIDNLDTPSGKYFEKTR